MNDFELDTLAEAMEIWPPAPQGLVELGEVQPVPRPSVWLQLGLGLVAGILFVPIVWLCMVLLLPHSDTTSLALVGVAFFAALAVSVLAWRHYRAFTLIFTVVSSGIAFFTLFIVALSECIPS